MNWMFFFSAFGILLWFAALLYLRSYVRRRTSAGYILSDLKEEIRLLEASIDEKTERDLELLEERIHVLRELLEEAQKRITVYAREMDRRKAQDEAFAASGRQSPNRADILPPEVPPARQPKKTSAKRKKTGSSLIDSIEIRELNLAQANSAYRAQASFGTAAIPASPAPAAVPERAPNADADASAPAGDSFPAGTRQSDRAVPAARDISRQDAPRFTRSQAPVVSQKPPSLRERVAELYAAGFSEDLIASRLGISVDAARLYMNSLRPKKKKASG